LFAKLNATIAVVIDLTTSKKLEDAPGPYISLKVRAPYIHSPVTSFFPYLENSSLPKMISWPVRIVTKSKMAPNNATETI